MITARSATGFGTGLGVWIYGLGAILLGLVGLAWGDFALQWQPVPASLPGRTALAYGVAAVLALAGAAVFWRRSAAAGAAVLAGLYAVGVAALHWPRAAGHLTNIGVWNGVAEQLALVAGGLIAFAACARAHAQVDPALAARLSRIGRLVFGLCLLVFGAAHFAYLDFTASMVPRWLPPSQVFWAGLVGVAHIAAGLAILSGVQARLAAVLLTAMFGSFSFLVHGPALAGDLHSHLNWVANGMNLALTGAAWVVADSLARRSPA